MEINRCLSCMQETQGGACPHCGFDPEKQPQPEYALPYKHILHGRYMIGKVLGQGGFGITYVGFDLALQVKVAIKEFYPNGQAMRNRTMGLNLCWSTTAQSQTMRESGMSSFLKEARKMSRVERIAEVVRVRDTFAENETAYIVMDFVEGETLKARLEREGAISWPQAQKIFRPVISAMAKVHEAGIIHRDLSPDNLMLEPDGSVKILDLGAAKDLTSNSGVSSMQVIKGGFSPVEQYGVSGGSGTWTDVYSIAATIYYTLSGTLPTPAIDRMTQDTLNWNLPRLRSLPYYVREALQKAMAVNFKERTQTMEALLEGFRPPVAPADPKPDPKPVPKPEPKSHLGSCTPQKEPVTPPGKPPKKPVILWVGIGAVALALLIFLLCGHIHSWKDATCLDPRTCSSCGETEGLPLGHDYTPADCEHPKTCTRCGKTRGRALGHKWEGGSCTEDRVCSVCGETDGKAVGHNWIEATYDYPKTCLNCGKTEGYVKGYYPVIVGTWGSETVQPGWTTGSPLILDQPVINCVKLTLNLDITPIYGHPYGYWSLYGKNLDGKWETLGSFDVPDDKEMQVVLEFNSPKSFTEIFAGVSHQVQYDTSWSDDYYLLDVYCRDE